MLKYILILVLINITQIYALINNYPENDTISNDIMSNDIMSDLPPEENNPLVAVYSNLMYTLKYPEDVELNGYIKFSKNDDKKEPESKNSNKMEETVEKTTEYFIDTTQNSTYQPSKNDIHFNSLSWEERWNNVYVNLKNFLKKHDVELKFPYYEDKVVRLSLRNWINNGSMIELKLYPDGKIDATDEEKLPKEELQSLTRLKSMIKGLFAIVYQVGFTAVAVVAYAVMRLISFPGVIFLAFFPLIAVIKLAQYLFFGTSILFQ